MMQVASVLSAAQRSALFGLKQVCIQVNVNNLIASIRVYSG